MCSEQRLMLRCCSRVRGSRPGACSGRCC
jgi:hypothetical protein